MKLITKQKVNLKKLINELINVGYCRESDTLDSGSFSQKGDSIYIWPVNHSFKVRIDLFGNIIENIFAINDIKNQKMLSSIKIENNFFNTEEGKCFPYNYIVHPVHGVGIYKYIITRPFDSAHKQFIKIEYAKGDILLFPLERIKEIMLYLGSRKPKLTRLHSDSWKKTKERIQRNLLQLARELLKIYSERSINKRDSYKNDQSFLRVLEESFDYQLTNDQKKSLEEIVRGLTTKDFPQDHLLVGDVGFGKTEVALRAASVVLASGKQVAILVPTTILSAQHFSLIKNRFASLPIAIAELSRISQNHQTKIIDDINQGKVDIIVGTHKLLSEKINFENLGLLIIDEEQRFGVEQKEKIKKIKQNIDVLSLSATPIPRTLFMSLSGLRQISIINEAPKERQGVKNIISYYSEKGLVSTIKNEVARHGQIYLIHNRVQTINVTKTKIINLLNSNGIKARDYQDNKIDDSVILCVAHGQMPEEKLANIMSKFIEGKIDILISSTIVENGLDHPNANTLIVDHAEKFGLSDLYQLRGRIGRRSKKAYAFFIIGGILNGNNQKVELTKNAQQRIEAISDVEEIGGGWQLALKDLEIRGSGNLLGREQHGYMEAIGLVLYSKLLKEAVDKVKQEELKKHLRAKINYTPGV